MQIDQILIRPRDEEIIAQHTNSIGRSGGTAIPYADLNQTQRSALTTLQGLVEAKLPPDPSAQVVQEIADLEARLAELRQSIGVA